STIAEGSLDFHSDASSDSFSRHSIPDHSSPDLLSTSTGPSRKRRRSPMTSIPALSHISRALSPVCADLIPSPKRVRDSGYLVDIKVDPREKIPAILRIVLPTVPLSLNHIPALHDITPASPDYSPTSPNYSPASDTESNPSEDPSSDHIPPLPAMLPFISSADDTADSDTPP
nr:hypothetical protein [Tanacetum cinerariifolium]